MDITFITGNPAKAAHLSEYFRHPVGHRKLDLPEIQSLDLREVVEAKAREAFAVLGTPVLVEDVSLVFHALGELPGPLIKWFLHSLGNDGLCRLLNGYEDRSVTAHLMYGLHDGQTVHIFEGSTDGTLAATPRGATTFGWDPVFIPVGYDKTWAEMSADEKNLTSMRFKAQQKLAAFLEGK